MTLSSFQIRLAVPGDINLLPEIERQAGSRFREFPELGIPAELYEDANTTETFAEAQRAGQLWVATGADGAPIGFAMVMDLAGLAHLEEIDVLPAHGQRGIGTALVATVCAWARDAGYLAVTLRTFGEVPWNAPFYQRQGFQVVDSDALSPVHVGLEAVEQQQGLPTDNRVTMVRYLDVA